MLEDISDEAAELFLIDTNIQARELSPKLRAQKVADARNLINTLKQRGEIEVRSVRRAVAESTGVSESTVILQTRIAEKLDKDLLEFYAKVPLAYARHTTTRVSPTPHKSRFWGSISKKSSQKPN